jgi:hypothetical protein
MPGRKRPGPGAYLWRGLEASQYITEIPGQQQVAVDRSHDDGFGISTTLSLPSPIIGANPTTVRDNPALSTISHFLEIHFDYSILDQEIHGNLLHDTDPAPEEGLIRSWKSRKWLDVHSDLSSATISAAPSYSDEKSMPPRCGLDFDSNHVLESTKARHFISLSRTSTMMRPVRVDPDQLQHSIREHWKEMAGMCACFGIGGVCEPAVAQMQTPCQEIKAGP